MNVRSAGEAEDVRTIVTILIVLGQSLVRNAEKVLFPQVIAPHVGEAAYKMTNHI